MVRAFFFNAALLLITQLFAVGCSSENYLVHEVVKETIVEVEVPVYIETEIPTDNEDAEIWVDSFTQPRSVDGVDILWVIDTSGSMNRYDENLLSGIEVMLNALPPSGWRLAMISNDPATASVEAQFPLVPGDDIVDAEAMYAAMGRGNREEGFDAAYEYIVNNPYASTWMRPDAALLVVFVSDEEDQSDAHFPLVQDFISWYQTQRGSSAFLSSIINLEHADSVCATPPNTIDIGHRYMEATNWFGGIIVDICSDDWSAGVTDASVQVEPHEEWPLTHVPVEATIRVFIDGALNWDWSYDSTLNSVIFTVVPSGGELVEIGYIIDSTPGDDDDSADTGEEDTG
ncbi:MAG: hypothetical protein CML56_00935 [Rhodobacteraceae bacterium]|nr:hypothetical protein [Paracoccaceae bacterium]